MTDLTVPITLGGVTFGVRDADGAEFLYEKITGWHGGPGVRGQSSDLLDAHGASATRGRRSGRTVSLSGTVSHASSRAAVAAGLRRLTALLADGGFSTLTVADPDYGTLSAEVQLAPGSEPLVDWYAKTAADFQLTLLAPDPRKYGPEQSVVTGLPEDTSALVFPLFSPSGVLEFGTPGSTGRVTLVNEGMADSWPVFFVAGPLLDGFELTELVTGARLRYVGPVGAGQSVTLDPRRGWVLLDGNADRRQSLVIDDWWAVPAGSSRQVRFASLGAFDPQARLVASVSPAFW